MSAATKPAAFNARRFAQLVALLDSHAEGEAHAALAAANRMLGRCGMAWRDIAEPMGTILAAASPEMPAHALEAQRILALGLGQLTAWEAAFLRGIVGFRRLTAKQRTTLDELAAKVA